MSRGPGRIERRILEVFDKHRAGGDLVSIAAEVYQVPENADGTIVVTAAQRFSVSRAVERLAQRGEVFHLGNFPGSRRRLWTRRVYESRYALDQIEAAP